MKNIKIAVAVFDTIQNNRTTYTMDTYRSLYATINTETTEVYFVDNASCEKTKKFLKSIEDKNFHVITNTSNEGTAEAINKVIKLRNENDYVVKLDNDVTFGQYGWADKMVECFKKDEKLGVLGLKRVDLPNSPFSKEYPTELKMLPHELNERWLVIEVCGDVIGTCLMLSPRLLDKIGYLWQPSCYGFDDTILCHKSLISGFYNAFYPSVDICHLDDGKNPYTQWKRKQAGLYLQSIDKIIKEYHTGERSLYYEPK